MIVFRGKLLFQHLVFGSTILSVLVLHFPTVFLATQYYGQSEPYSEALDYLNMIFTGVFTIEFVLKFFAFRVKVTTPSCAIRIVLLLSWALSLYWMSFKLTINVVPL